MLHLDVPEPTAPRADPPPALRAEVAPSTQPGRVGGRLLVAAVVAALLPVVVATVRAVHRGWLPVGDNAYFAIRARDVLTEHHPLLGTWTSASITAGTNFNNPGPLLFDLLAAPAKLVPGGAGVAVGAALLNAAAIVGIAVAARRRGGPLVGVLAMVVTTALCWSMGSELLFDPWQPHSLLLTSLLLAVLVWSLAAGDVVALPWVVGVASLLVQTHLSYAVLVVAQVVVGVVGLLVALRHARRDATGWPAVRTTAVRSLLAAGVVLAACWAQPLVEQVTGEGVGNLSRLAANAGSSPETVGPALGTRLVARVVAAPPWLLRPSFSEALHPSERAAEIVPGIHLPDLPSTTTAVWSVGVVAVALAACGLWGARRRDRSAVAAVAVAAAAVAAGLVTAASLPVGFLGIAPHQFRWLWPLAAFTVLAVAAAAAGAGVRSSRTATRVTAAATAAVVVLAAWNLPTHNVGAGPADDDWAIPVVRRINEQMVALEGEGPLVIDMRGIRFAEPYSGPVMAELQRRGIPFVVDDEGMVRQLGPSRRAAPGDRRLLIREGDGTQEAPPGARRAVLVEGLDAAGKAELAQLRAEVVGTLRALGGVPLNERGRAALAGGDLPVLASVPAPPGPEPEALLASRELAFLVEHDLLERVAGRRAVFERHTALQRTWDRETVALFVAPPDGGTPGP